jgi:hypothetical protein
MENRILNIKSTDVLFRTYNFGELMTGERGNKEGFGDTAKKLVKNLFNEMIRNTTKLSISNKYTSKGTELEDSAINRIAKVNGWGFFINANKLGIELKDDIGIGHPDGYKESIIGFDAKCSYTDDTFPLFDKELKNTNYIWQAKRLAMMSNLDKWYVCYSLENTPMNLVINDAWKLWKEGGNEGQFTESFLDEVIQMHNFDHLADWERIKTFEVKCTSDDIDLINKRAEMARNYFMELVDIYKSMKK